MIISVTSLKGGVGKSTLSMNLAVGFQQIGMNVCLYDSDNNQSMMDWQSIRQKNYKSDPASPKPIPAFEMSSDLKRVEVQIESLLNTYDAIIMDGTPHLDIRQKLVISASNYVVIPYTPGAFDLWTVPKIVDLIEGLESVSKRKIPRRIVLNRFDVNVLHDRENRQFFLENNYPLTTSTLYDRPAAYKDSVNAGVGILEYNNKKAKDEFFRLFREICEELDSLGLLDLSQLNLEPQPAAK